jgi:hypothetical protein
VYPLHTRALCSLRIRALCPQLKRPVYFLHLRSPCSVHIKAMCPLRIRALCPQLKRPVYPLHIRILCPLRKRPVYPLHIRLLCPLRKRPVYPLHIRALCSLQIILDYVICKKLSRKLRCINNNGLKGSKSILMKNSAKQYSE